MKMDKDALVKHKFWVLLGVFALLWIICLSFVAVNAGGPVDEAKKNYDAAKAAVAKYPRPKNASFLPPWQKYGDTFTKHKNEVWKIAWFGDQVKPGETLPPGQRRWEGQSGMYDWPYDDNHPLNTLLLYPDSPFENRLREWYKTKDAYGKEFDDLRLRLQPDGSRSVKGTPADGPLGAVAFKGGYDNVMKPIDFEAAGASRTPDAEECWLAQEDFWVKRELLYVVSDALSMAAHLDPVADAKDKDKPDAPAKKDKPDAPAKDAKILGRQVFRNASWEVTLLFDKDENGKVRISPDSRIKNVHVSHREQDLGNPAVPIDGAFFRIRQNDYSRMFHFEGERVPWGKERSLGVDKGFPVSINPTNAVELEQVFDRGDTPIASIDEIRIPYLSNRNANRPLVAAPPKRFGKTEAPAADASKTTPGGLTSSTAPGMTSPMPGGATAPPGASGMQRPGGMGVLGGAGGAQTPVDATPNINLDRARYLFVTDQSRHLPLAMTLAVDQSHLNEILVALANSRLRFQTTQVEFRRMPAAGANPAGGMGFPSGGSYGGSQGPTPSEGGAALTPATPPAGMRSPMPMNGATTTATTTTPSTNPNLVEVTIYGIASLYERPRVDKK
jgi:hypothetical protein